MSSGPRKRTSTPYLAAALVAVALTGVVTLSAPGNAALQAAMELAGLGSKSGLEQEQRRQAAVIAGLDGMIAAMSAALADVAKQVQASGPRDDELRTRIAELDREIGSLREQIARQDMNAGATRDFAKDLARQDAGLRGTITDLAGLRHDFEQSRGAHEASIAALQRRLTQVESTLAARDVTSSVTRKPPRRSRSATRIKRVQAAPPVLSAPPDIMAPVLD